MHRELTVGKHRVFQGGALDVLHLRTKRGNQMSRFRGWATIAAIALGAAIAFQKLNGTATGVLVVALTLYFAAPVFDIEPLTLTESFTELLSMPAEALLALAGVLLAYVALSGWRSQKKTELRIETATSVQEFFQVATDAMLEWQLYVENHASLRRKFTKNEPGVNFALFVEVHLKRKAKAALAARERLLDYSLAVHSFRSRHLTVLTTHILAPFIFDFAAKALGAASEKCWVVLPSAESSVEQIIEFVQFCEPGEWEEFSLVADKSRASIAMCAGAIAGAFRGEILQPSLSAAVVFWRDLCSQEKE